MMKSVPVVRMALSGLAMFALACAGGAGAPPAKTLAVQQVKPVTVKIAGVACGHTVTPRSHELVASNQDELEWRIMNITCGSEQKVLICSYRGDTLFNPFFPCRSRPTAGLEIGTTFTVKSGQQETLNCRAKVQGRNYTKLVLVGAEVPDSGCPGAAPLEPRNEAILSHMLDVEIFP